MISLIRTNNFKNVTNTTIVPSPTNATSSSNKNNTRQRLLVSPQGNYLLRYDGQKNIQLYDIHSQNQIQIGFKEILIKVAFSLNQTQLIYSYLNGVDLFQIQTKQKRSIIPKSIWNKITDFEFNSDQTALYFINKSSLYAMEYPSGKLLIDATLNLNCLPSKMSLDSVNNIIVTSSLSDKPNSLSDNNCYICKWNITNNKFIKISYTNISYCVVNDIYIFGDTIAVTKKRLNGNKMNTAILEYQSLNSKGYTNESENNMENSGFIVNFEDIFIQYFQFTKTFYIYKDNFTNKLNEFKWKNQIRSLAYNPIKQQFYCLSKNTSNNQIVIQIISLAYNCSQISSALSKSLDFQPKCTCPPLKIFSPKSLKCQASQCNSQQTCLCPKGQIYNNYSLKCQISCIAIDNSLPTLPYNNPLRCSCKDPYMWNPQQNDCSKINCNLVNNSTNNSAVISLCQINNISSQDVQGSSAGLVAGLVILFLVLLGAVLLYFYKKCLKKESSESSSKEQKVVQTDRNLSLKAGNPSLKSNQHLSTQAKSVNNKQQKKQDVGQEENIQNFSIQDEEQIQKDHYFSQIQSNINKPLS